MVVNFSQCTVRLSSGSHGWEGQTRAKKETKMCPSWSVAGWLGRMCDIKMEKDCKQPKTGSVAEVVYSFCLPSSVCRSKSIELVFKSVCDFLWVQSLGFGGARKTMAGPEDAFVGRLTEFGRKRVVWWKSMEALHKPTSITGSDSSVN